MVQWSYPTDLFTTKTRTGRITVPIGYQPGVGQLVATYGAGQPAHGFAMGPKQSQSALLAGTALPLDWRQAVTQNAPTQRGGAGMCYDSLRKQIILFGGYDGTRRDDTWIFDLASQEWQQVSSGGPAGRSNMMLVYDPVRDRAVMFGGNTGVASAQTYEFDPAVRQWTLAAPVASPTARFDYAATYDTARSRVLIFGGVDAGAVLLRETYEYDGLTWTLVSNVGPTARRGSAIAYDASQGLTLLFSGLDGLGYNQETWSWNGATATWANLAPAAQPSGRAYHVGWYDSVRQTCYVAFGTNGVVEYNDTWSYSWAGNTWTQTSTSAATGTRFYTEGAFDDYHGVYALFGGLMGATFFADTWTYARGPVGLAAAARLVFEPIGSNDFYGNATVAGLCAKSSVDGSSGMRDGLRATMGGAYNPLGNRLYFPAAGVAIAGASNVSWRYDLMYRRATVGNSARASIYFSGDPAGAESFNTLTDDLTPTEWVKGGAACLPVGSAHTLCFPACGAANNLDNCDFAEPTLIKNTDQPAPYYLRTGTAAAETVAAQTTTIAGAVGKYAPPAKGHLLFNLLGAPGATERMGEIVGTIWRSLPNVLGSIAGSLWVRCAPDVQLRVLDTNGYEVATVRTGYVPRAGEALDVDAVWDAATALPVLSAIGTDRLALMLNGTFGVSGASAAWVPAAKASISSVKMAHDN